MSGPLIFINTFTIKPGKLEEARKRLHELVEHVDAHEPRLIGFNVYFDEDGSTVTAVQVHPDSASMEFHLGVVSAHIAEAFEVLDATKSTHILGHVSESLAAKLAAYADPASTTTAMPVHEAGFLRAATP